MWGRNHKTVVLDVKPRRYYQDLTERMNNRYIDSVLEHALLRIQVRQAIDMLHGTHNDLRATKAKAILEAALRGEKSASHEVDPQNPPSQSVL